MLALPQQNCPLPPGLAQNLLAECTALYLLLSGVLGGFLFPVNPLLKLGLPSLVSKSSATIHLSLSCPRLVVRGLGVFLAWRQAPSEHPGGRSLWLRERYWPCQGWPWGREPSGPTGSSCGFAGELMLSQLLPQSRKPSAEQKLRPLHPLPTHQVPGRGTGT